MDFIEGLPLSNGHDTILVVVCHLTNMALFILIFRDIDAEDLAPSFCHRSFKSMAHPQTSSPIEESTSSHAFGDRSASYSVSRPTSQWPITQRPTGRLNESTRSWNNIFGYTST